MAKIHDDFERQLRLHCNLEYDKKTGDEMVCSNLSAVIIAFDEWLKTCAGNPVEQSTEQQCNIADVNCCAFVDEIAKHTEYIRGRNYKNEYRKLMIPVIEYNELKQLASDYDKRHCS